MDMDNYISKSLKNWAAGRTPDRYIRAKLLLTAASQRVHMVAPTPDPRTQNLFGRPILDGAFGYVMMTNLSFFNLSTISMRMMI